MKKIFAIFLSLFLFLNIVSNVFAEPTQSESGDVPEKNGDYPDPKNRKLRVRVFVHPAKTNLTQSPVTNCTDSDSTASVASTGWHLPKNVTYRLNTSSVALSIGATDLATLSANAFTVWQDAVTGKVTFSRGADTLVSKSSYDGQNVIAWGRVNSRALAVTYTRYYPSTGDVVDVDTIFNKKYVWAWTNPLSFTCSNYSNAYDAQDILTHELGHWMGLNDHYESIYADNTMYGYGSKGEIKKNTLTTGDKANLNVIYP